MAKPSSVEIQSYSADGKATGKHLISNLVHVFTIRKGKVSRFINQVDMVPMAAAHTV